MASLNHSPEELRAWFRNVEPICAELFNAAHAMCGNYDLAEYALRSAILDVWLESAGGGMGFRERLRGALRREAFAAALSDETDDAEFTWNGLPAAPEDDPVLAQLARERVQTQRLATLRYGCGLSPKAIARLTGLGPRQVRGELDRFVARCRRNFPHPDRARVEALIARSIRKQLSRGGADAPQPSQVYRAFEAEADGAGRAGHGLSRALSVVLTALLALAGAAAFWLFAVLVRPV